MHTFSLEVKLNGLLICKLIFHGIFQDELKAFFDVHEEEGSHPFNRGFTTLIFHGR